MPISGRLQLWVQVSAGINRQGRVRRTGDVRTPVAEIEGERPRSGDLENHRARTATPSTNTDVRRPPSMVTMTLVLASNRRFKAQARAGDKTVGVRAHAIQASVRRHCAPPELPGGCGLSAGQILTSQSGRAMYLARSSTDGTPTCTHDASGHKAPSTG